MSASSGPKIAYITGNSFNNTGDIAMVNGFLAELRSHLPNLDVTLLGNNLPRMEAAFPELIGGGAKVDYSAGRAVTPHDGLGYLAHLVKSVLNKTAVKTNVDRAVRLVHSGKNLSGILGEHAKLIQSMDAVVVGGGGCLNDLFGLTEPALVTAEIAAKVGIPVYLFGQSVGPFSKPLSLQRLRRIVEISQYFELREETGSMPWIEKSGADVKRISVAADSAMLIPTGPAQDGLKAIKTTFGHIPDRLMTINPRYLPESNKNVTLDDHIIQMAKIVDRLIEELELTVLSIPSLYKSTAYQSVEKPHMDRPVSMKIRALLKRPERFAVLDEPASVETVKAIHAQAVCSLSIAYHPTVFALSAGTPCFLAYTDEYLKIKNGGLADLWESRDWFTNIYDPLETANLPNRAEQMIATLPIHRARLKLKAAELTALVQNSVKKLADDLSI